jgi:hypothetical protein
VWWDRLSIAPNALQFPQKKERLVRIATVHGAGNSSWWARVLDEIGTKGADIVLLPEFMNGKDPSHAEDINTGLAEYSFSVLMAC